MTGLRALAVDDEPPALAELTFLLQADERVATVHVAADGPSALQVLREVDVDVVFLDVRMPGLTGLDLADLLRRFKVPPSVVFVTAYEAHAVSAFELEAVDYVLKPVRADRLAEAVRRVLEARRGPDERAEEPTPWPGATTSDTIPVELGGVTRFVRRADVRYVEAQGDYARLHTAEASHLVRVPLAALEERWARAGFVRIHRSLLVSLAHVDELRMESGRCLVGVGGEFLQVSRRHTRELRDLLVHRAGHIVRPAAREA